MALRKDAAVYREAPVEHAVVARDVSAPIYQAYVVARLTFIVAPIVMGLDKFVGILVNNRSWTDYLWPGIPRLTGIDGNLFMLGVGVIEIVAGILVFVSTRHFAWLVAAWLGAIIVNLLLLGNFWDVGMRDVGLMLGAIATARLAQGVWEIRHNRE